MMKAKKFSKTHVKNLTLVPAITFSGKSTVSTQFLLSLLG
jgi:hypothetical protein